MKEVDDYGMVDKRTLNANRFPEQNIPEGSGEWAEYELVKMKRKLREEVEALRQETEQLLNEGRFEAAEKNQRRIVRLTNIITEGRQN